MVDSSGSPDQNVSQLIDNAKKLVQLLQNQVAVVAGGDRTKTNSGSGRSNVDSLSTLSKRNNKTNGGHSSSFFQTVTGTTQGKFITFLSNLFYRVPK